MGVTDDAFLAGIIADIKIVNALTIIMPIIAQRGTITLNLILSPPLIRPVS